MKIAKKINKFLKRYAWPALKKRQVKKIVATSLIGLIHMFNIVVAAAPSDPLMATQEQLTKISSVAAVSQLEENYKVVRVALTGYSSTPDQTDDTPFITASNTVVRDGIVAANFLAFGTKVRMPELFGDKIFRVEDRMHSRFSNCKCMDIWFPNRATAKEFGVKETSIQILR